MLLETGASLACSDLAFAGHNRAQFSGALFYCAAARRKNRGEKMSDVAAEIISFACIATGYLLVILWTRMAEKKTGVKKK